MKICVYLLLMGVLSVGCSKEKDNNNGAESENKAPGIPVLEVPQNAKLCLESTVTFKWDPAADPDHDPITYQIQIALDAQFSNIVQTRETPMADQMIELEKNSLYYWRIKAVDSKGLSGSYSQVYTFYTAGDAKINHLPFAPQLLEPALGAANSAGTVSLAWTAVDADPQDTLLYDVYFDTANPPMTKISQSIPLKNTMATTEPEHEYFWRVIARDNHGGETTGQIWSFKTN